MSGKTIIHVIDDDAAMRDSLSFLLVGIGPRRAGLRDI
jgi:FixJ family two-component response regulator